MDLPIRLKVVPVRGRQPAGTVMSIAVEMGHGDHVLLEARVVSPHGLPQVSPVEARLTEADRQALERMRRCFREFPGDVGLMRGALDGRPVTLICTRLPNPDDPAGVLVVPQAILLEDYLRERIANFDGEPLPR